MLSPAWPLGRLRIAQAAEVGWGPVKRCCQGERRMDLGVGQQVTDLPAGRIVSVELPVVGSAAEVGADVYASGGVCRRALDACLAGELDQTLGFTVMFGSGHSCSDCLGGQ